MIGATIAAALARHAILVGLGTALVSMVLLWDSGRKAKWVDKGKQEVRVEIGKANDNAVKKADGVRARAQSGSVRNAKRDPYSID